MTALTDQAIAKIKDLIMSGEFAAASKLPKEQELAKRLGLSRNSLREAVRALTPDRRARAARRRRHVRHEPRAGAAADRHGLRQRPAHRQDAARAAPGAPHPRAGRDRAGGDPARPRTTSPRSSVCLADMDAAETTQAFIAADEEFHRDHRHGVGELDARLADPEPLRRDAPRPPLAVGARAGARSRRRSAGTGTSTSRSATGTAPARVRADLIHLSEGEQWLRQLIESEAALASLANADTPPPA